MTRSAILKIPNSDEINLPIIDGTVGPSALDVRSLYKNSGYFTYDPGFMSTASCHSKITYIDGEKGILMHRGYEITDLTENYDYMDVCHLLLHGNIPTKPEKEYFIDSIKHHTMVHEQLHFFFRGFPRHSHPMAMMVGTVSSLSAFYHDAIDITDEANRDSTILKIIAKVPTIAAMAYKYSVGLPFIYPDNSLSFSANLLNMMFSVPTEKYVINKAVEKALDKLLILHADHEQNASTSTVRLAGSSGTNPFAAISAGIASLWGPAHGGANEAVIRMLEEIGSKENIPAFIQKAKDKDDPFRLMGFGHRVYKNYDPRAKVLKKYCDEMLNTLNIKEDKLLAIALELERIALQDEYFIEKKLFPNVDFYSGIIYRALGIPKQMFTVFFALARTAGWVAQWKEMVEDPERKIGRPRQIYNGNTSL